MEIRLPNTAKAALGRLAIREFRDPPAQAAVIVIEHLRQIGLLDDHARLPASEIEKREVST